ncbi:unnamed protein product, partial [Callosobruchus maculatus]
MAVLRHLFPNRSISRFGGISCPPRSPDLSSQAPYVRRREGSDSPWNLSKINRDLLETVECNFRERLHHIMPDVIFALRY